MKNVKWPKSILIAGHRYKVLLSDTLIATDHLSGQADYGKHTITIDRQAPDKTVTLLHEIIHCVDRHYIEQRMEHPIIEPLSEGLYQALKSAGVDFDWREDARKVH